MKEFARFTAIIFMILGMLIILGGILFTFFGWNNPPQPVTTPSLFPDLSGVINLFMIFGGAAIGLQGLFLIAIGQGLWLLAGIYEQSKYTTDTLDEIYEQSEQTGKAISALMKRNNQV
jgi:hypothetical protein